MKILSFMEKYCALFVNTETPDATTTMEEKRVQAVEHFSGDPVETMLTNHLFASRRKEMIFPVLVQLILNLGVAVDTVDFNAA